MEATRDALIGLDGRVGRITLNRPNALNALNEAVASAMLEALQHWAADDNVKLVLVDSNGEKAFCAGGDLATLYKDGRNGDEEGPRNFWKIEYQLDRLISCYPKPYVAIMDGFVMGGGVGISSHGSHRIVTEHSVVAMPECSIGLITDAGGTLLLARAPGHLGEFLALTGTRMSAEDAIFAGFADLLVPRAALGKLKEQLVESGDISVLRSYRSSVQPSRWLERLPEINAIFGAPSLRELGALLKANDAEWIGAARVAMEKASPLAAAATFRAIRLARSSGSIDAALANEYRYVSRAMQHSDFLEGIRAAVIDKDRNPRWQHPDIEAVPDELVAFMLSEPDGGDPDFRTGEF